MCNLYNIGYFSWTCKISYNIGNYYLSQENVVYIDIQKIGEQYLGLAHRVETAIANSCR